MNAENNNVDKISEQNIKKANKWWILLSILLPPVGIILYFTWRKGENKLNAQFALKGGLTGTVIIAAVVAIISVIAMLNQIMGI